MYYKCIYSIIHITHLSCLYCFCIHTNSLTTSTLPHLYLFHNILATILGGKFATVVNLKSIEDLSRPSPYQKPENIIGSPARSRTGVGVASTLTPISQPQTPTDDSNVTTMNGNKRSTNKNNLENMNEDDINATTKSTKMLLRKVDREVNGGRLVSLLTLIGELHLQCLPVIEQYLLLIDHIMRISNICKFSIAESDLRFLVQRIHEELVHITEKKILQQTKNMKTNQTSMKNKNSNNRTSTVSSRGRDGVHETEEGDDADNDDNSCDYNYYLVTLSAICVKEINAEVF